MENKFSKEDFDEVDSGYLEAKSWKELFENHDTEEIGEYDYVIIDGVLFRYENAED